MVVSTTADVQLERLLQRDSRLSEEDARGRIASQWDINEKKKLADVVIENDSTKEDLEKRVAQVVRDQFSRSRLWTWSLRIPPIGLAFGTMIFLQRTYMRRRRNEKTS